MKRFVVTITREFGSLGRPIAKRLSELLEVEFYDRDIVEATAKQMNMPVSTLSDSEEKKTSFWNMLFPLGTDSLEQQKKIFECQSQIISRMAGRGSCIIVGRCADYILEDDPDAIHVYIYASYADRLANCVGSLGMKKEDAKKMINEVDKARLNYHKYFAGYAPSDPKHKHIIINSALLEVEGTAQALAAIVKKKYGD
ncbi:MULTISPECIES: AAA family ATPase [unclassified Butyrivibrio]|uniref:cytidylate kinase-like family protein n=1 Tax=unclassified Butyrivibrio TaxID=2639466 RepID=UPI0003F79330|nr:MULTISPECIES: cytidylate kinase-like family protein [unclassified Butyrivibrio]